jgi:hypothetical protein
MMRACALCLEMDHRRGRSITWPKPTYVRQRNFDISSQAGGRPCFRCMRLFDVARVSGYRGTFLLKRRAPRIVQ